jgi:hypothetical protein
VTDYFQGAVLRFSFFVMATYACYHLDYEREDEDNGTRVLCVREYILIVAAGSDFDYEEQRK